MMFFFVRMMWEIQEAYNMHTTPSQDVVRLIVLLVSLYFSRSHEYMENLCQDSKYSIYW